MLPPDVDGLAMLPDVSELPMEELLPIGAELPVMGAGVVSGIGVVTAGAVLAGVLGIVVVSSFLPQAARAITPDNRAMVRGVR